MASNTHFVVKPSDVIQFRLIEFTRIEANRPQRSLRTSNELLPIHSAHEILRTALESGIYHLESADHSKIVVAFSQGDNNISRLVFAGGNTDIQFLLNMLETEGFNNTQ